jgi:nucleotide-binding universal stress UspA family protein
MIAWNGSYEVANAIRSSTGLLKLASTVHVVQIAEDDKDETFPSTRLLEYLSRHDIHAELSTIEAGVGLQDSYVIADMLMARARELDAEYVVMGGYSHNRVSEYIFGGVTRTLLTNKTGPLLIAH